MIRIVAVSAGVGLLALGMASSASAQPRAGAKCTAKAGKTVVRGGVTLRCVKTKRGKRWRKVVAPSPAPTPTPAPSPTPSAGGAGIVPSREWLCAVGYYPNTSYQKLVTTGSGYTVSWTDGTGASSGTVAAGTHAPLNAGTPILFQGGAWAGHKGEFAPAGTVTNPGRPPITVDQVYVDGGLNNSYYPVTCSPK